MPHDARFWTVCVAAAVTPFLFAYVAPSAALLGLAVPDRHAWTVALAIAGVAVGWRTLGWPLGYQGEHQPNLRVSRNVPQDPKGSS
jgi:hypothetical protein